MKDSLLFLLKVGAMGACLCLVGFLGGKLIGTGMLHNVIAGEKGTFLLFRPTHEFYSTYRSINSYNEFERLSGYYSLLDSNMINQEFFIKRYGLENSPALKRTIIWILSFSGDEERTKQFYSDIYKGSPKRIQEEILKSLAKMDSEYYSKFKEKFKINRKN